MSVWLFSPAELANLAVVASIDPHREENKARLLHDIVPALARYSKANHKALKASYGNRVTKEERATTEEELIGLVFLRTACGGSLVLCHAAHGMRCVAVRPVLLLQASYLEAVRTMRMLTYNAVDQNGGRDHLDSETAKDLLEIAVALLPRE